MIKKLILALIFVIVSSCSKEDDSGIARVKDYTGKFRLSYVAGIDACTNSSSSNNSVSSENDLEINANDRFKLKIYSLNSGNDCIVSEILEGKITITGSFYENPYGNMEYDNSNRTTRINLRESVNGKHNEITIYDESVNGSTISYSYGRTN